jgi:hypothetical protein
MNNAPPAIGCLHVEKILRRVSKGGFGKRVSKIDSVERQRIHSIDDLRLTIDDLLTIDDWTAGIKLARARTDVNPFTTGNPE